MRAAIVACDGVEVNTEGDGMFAAFGDAGQAIAACLDAQRRLAAEDWPEDGEVQVRMGLHTGVARPTPAADYVAVAVHQAARICAAAHGGQVLLSADTARLVRHVLPLDASLIDRGPFMLSGFDEPERIYQLAHPDLRSMLPPRCGRRRRNPTTCRTCVCRSLAARTISKRSAGLLRGGRLVTVVGAGGAGKTRLAVEIAARLASRFEGGVHLCDLSPQTDPDLVEAAISEAFGIRDSVAADRTAEVAKLLGRSLPSSFSTVAST